jgi:uncharacterized lipoprotein
METLKALILGVLAVAALVGCSQKSDRQKQEEWNRTHLTEGEKWKP